MARHSPLHRLLPALAGGSVLLLTPLSVRAHAIQSNLERIDALSASLQAPEHRSADHFARIRLDSSFSTGEPVAGATVRLVAPDGSNAIDLGSTDDKGRLTFAVPQQAGAGWELQVDGGPGHRDYLELPSAPHGPAGAKAAGQPGGSAALLPLAREWRQLSRAFPLQGLTGSLGFGVLSLGGLGLGLGFGLGLRLAARSMARPSR